MCESQWSTLLTSKPRRRRLRLLSETRCSALHIQGRDPRTPSGGEGRGARTAQGASSPDTRGPAPRPESHLPPGSGAAHRLGRNSQRLPSVRGLSLVPSSPAVSSYSPQLSHLWGDAWGHWRTAGSRPLHPSQARFLGLGFLGTVEKPAPKRWSQVYNFTVFFGYSSSVSITKSQIYLCPIF